MTPDEMSERLAAWVNVDSAQRHAEFLRGLPTNPHGTRRVVCVEPDGPRRTWVLYEGGRQVGLVRLRAEPGKRPRPVAGLDGPRGRFWCHLCCTFTDQTVRWPWGFHKQHGCLECEQWLEPVRINEDERIGNEPPAWTWEASDRTRAMLGLGES